jgi:hypothetical protein
VLGTWGAGAQIDVVALSVNRHYRVPGKVVYKLDFINLAEVGEEFDRFFS